MTRYLNALCVFAALIIPYAAFASKDDHHDHEGEHHDHDEEHYNHEVHVHGQAKMYLVIEGAELLLELKSPAANVFGFEHAPKNDDQSKAVAEAKDIFAKAGNVLKITGGKCSLATHEVELPFEDHDSHRDEHADESAHADVEASYLFECVDSQAVKEIDIQLFDYFDGFEEIDVEWIIHSKQGSRSLTKDNHLIKI